MCLSAPSTPKYDPPVTLEAPLPEETPGVLEEPGDISTGRYRSKANRRGTQMFRTQNNTGLSEAPLKPNFTDRPYIYRGGTNPNATRSLETRDTASAKKKNVSANPGLTISRR